MRARADKRNETTVCVFLETAAGADACDRLVGELGGATAGRSFVPKYGEEAKLYGWGRYYRFPLEKTEKGYRRLRRAFEDREEVREGYGIKVAARQLKISPPANKRITINSGLKTLHQLFPNLTPLVEIPTATGLAEITVGDPALATWLANLLGFIALSQDAAPAIAPAAAGGLLGNVAPGMALGAGGGGTPGGPTREAWLTNLATYCERNAIEDTVLRLADLTPIEEAVRKAEWSEADWHIFSVRKGVQPFDRAGLADLELCAAVGLENLQRAGQILEAEPPPPLEHPLALRAAVQARLELGQVEAAEQLLAGRLVEEPETDAEGLVWLLAAKVEHRQGRRVAALRTALQARFYGTGLRTERRQELETLARELAEELREGRIGREELLGEFEIARAEGDQEALSPLLDALTAPGDGASAAGGVEGPGEAEVAEQVVPRGPTPEEIFQEAVQLSASSPVEARERVRKLVEASPDHRDVPTWWLKVGDLDRQLEGDEAAVGAYWDALRKGPDRLGDRLDSHSLVRPLRVLLVHGGPDIRRDPVLADWLKEITSSLFDPTLLLLCAELSVEQGEISSVASLVERAVPEVVASPGPSSAEKAISQLALGDERKAAMLSALYGGLKTDPGMAATRAIGELLGAVEPTNAETLSFLNGADSSKRDEGTTALRIDRVQDELDDPSSSSSEAARKSVLANLSGCLSNAAQSILMSEDARVSTDDLARYVELALRALLAAGRQGEAAQLLRDAMDLGKSKFTPSHQVGLADVLYDFPGALEPATRQTMINAYRDAGYVLVERLPQTDETLLGVIVETMKGLDPQEAADLSAMWRTYARDAAPAAENPVAEAPRASLAGLSIAIAGADAPARHRAAEELTSVYGAAEVVHIPPGYERVLSEHDVQERLRGVDLVVEVWRQTKHQTSLAVHKAVERLNPAPICKPVSGTGHSSIVATVINWARTSQPHAGHAPA